MGERATLMHAPRTGVRCTQRTHDTSMSESDPRLELLWRSLANVIDPEIGLDIVTLGLVYGVTIDDDVARVTHTLTTPGCPMERLITDGIRAAAGDVVGVRQVETDLVWDPAWHSGMIAPNAW
jgi:metal-sulfur cluster biosynthetic enzyme